MALASTVVAVEGPYNIHDMSISDAYNVSGGALLALSGARTAVNSADGANLKLMILAGVAQTDKEAGNGRLNIGAAQSGTFKLTNGGAATIAAGDFVSLSGANTISGMGTAFSQYTAGQALQSIATAALGEVKIMGIMR